VQVVGAERQELSDFADSILYYKRKRLCYQRIAVFRVMYSTDI